MAGTAAASTAAERTHSGAASSPGCPHLEEFERCDRAVIDCRTYSWRWTAWGTCLVGQPGAPACWTAWGTCQQDGLGHLPAGRPGAPALLDSLGHLPVVRPGAPAYVTVWGTFLMDDLGHLLVGRPGAPASWRTRSRRRPLVAGGSSRSRPSRRAVSDAGCATWSVCVATDRSSPSDSVDNVYR